MSPDTPIPRCPQCGKSFPATVRICPEDGTVLEHASPIASQVGTVLDGKYRLEAFLSQGGMGAVYRAAHVLLGKTVAVKLIKPELVTSADVVRRFQREARAATALNHPNIVAVYDLGQTTEGTLYIAMEFVNGPTLKAVIERGGPVSPARTIGLLRQVASALSVAHRHGIVHRDLKPHNIMLAPTDEGGEVVKLVDFGIAKTFDEATQLTMTGFVMGTPHYMAPEQAEGRLVDQRSDLYSLGVIMYEMLTGQVPFNDTSAAAILMKHMKETPVPPSLKNPALQIPAPLEAVTMRCLEKDPAMRFQSAEEFAAALEQAAASVPGGAEGAQATLLSTPAAQMATMPAGTAPNLATLGPTPPSPASPNGTPTTRVEPAAPPDTKPTARVQPSPPAAVSADTRPTVHGSPASVASAASPPAKRSKVGLALVAVMALAIGAAYYVQNRGSDTAPAPAATQPVAEAPPASPATALPSAPQPATSTPPPAADADRSPSSPAGGAVTPPAVPATAAVTPAAAPPAGAGSALVTKAAPAAPKNSADAKGAAPTAAPASATASASKPAPAAALPIVTPPRASASAETAQAAPSMRRAEEAAAQAPPPVMPENPAVFFHCAGAAEICSALKAAVDDALDKGGLGNVRNAARADIDVAARVDGVQEKVDRQFGTTFNVRTYSIDVNAEAPRTSEAVSMPSSTTLSYDPQYGAERVSEKARLVAGEIVDRVKAFAKKKRGG